MTRPKPKLTLTTSDKLIEAVCFLMLAGCWVYLGVSYGNLPDTIPSHFNMQGVADNFDDKSHLMRLMAVYTGVYLLIFVSNFFPNHFNYLSEITEENAQGKYAIAIQMMRVLNSIIGGLFTYLLVKTITNLNTNQTDLDTWVMPLFFILLTGASVYYVVKLAKN